MHWWRGDITSPQQTHCSSLGASFAGVPLREETSVVSLSCSIAGGSEPLCAFPLCIFITGSVLKTFSHKLHLNLVSTWLELSKSIMVSVSGSEDFRFRNSSFLFRFLLKVDGLAFFFFFSTTFVVAVPLVSKEKVKEVPVWVRLRVNFWPLLASAWQRSRHWLSMAGSPPVIIFTGQADFGQITQPSCRAVGLQPFYLKYENGLGVVQTRPHSVNLVNHVNLRTALPFQMVNKGSLERAASDSGVWKGFRKFIGHLEGIIFHFPDSLKGDHVPNPKFAAREPTSAEYLQKAKAGLGLLALKMQNMK